MFLMRWLCISILTILMVGCGGGGSLTSEDGTDPNAAQYTLSISGVDSDTNESKNELGANSPIKIIATLTESDKPVANAKVVFSSDDFANMTPVSGSVLTNSNGEAVITISANENVGAGTITATFTDPNASQTDSGGGTGTGGTGTGGTGTGGTTSGQTQASFNFSSTGSSPVVVANDIVLTVEVVDSQGNVFNSTNPISKDNLGIAKATLTNEGAPFINELIEFQVRFTGRLEPLTGTSATEAGGIASITVGSGVNKGAGQLIAKYEAANGDVLTQTTVFYSSGDDAIVDVSSTKLDIRMLKDCPGGWEAQRDTTSLDELASACTATNKIDAVDEVDVYVRASDSNTGNGITGVLIPLEADIGTILGGAKAVTDSFGYALFKYLPPLQGGAGEIKTTYNEINAAFAFTSGAENLVLEATSGLLSDTNGNLIPLGAGETTLLTVTIKDQNNELISTPIDVAFASQCAGQDKATIDENSTSVSGIAFSTYKNDGCDAKNDTISITIAKGGTSESTSLSLPVSAAKPQSIQFTEIENKVLALKGTGGQTRKESSKLTFKLIDSLSASSANKRVDFLLNNKNSDATISPNTGSTDSEGNVQVTISSGQVSSTFAVRACYIPEDSIPDNQDDEVTCWPERFDRCSVSTNKPADCQAGNITLVDQDKVIQSLSTSLSVTSGLPTQSSITLSSNIVSSETLYYPNEKIPLVVLLSDRFGNFVPDGTRVYLSAEGGAVGTVDETQFNPTLDCEVTDGQCQATWVSQGNIPFGDSDYWGNKINSYNPKLLYKAKEDFLKNTIASPTYEQIIAVTNSQLPAEDLENTRNCDLYFGSPAPCINGIKDASIDPDGVPLRGRVTLLAIADGEELFNDANGNGLFDENEFSLVFDKPEAFRDDNENGVYNGDNCLTGVGQQEINPCSPYNTDSGHFETFLDSDGDESYTNANRIYDGLSCTEEQRLAGNCNKRITDVFDSHEIIMSGSIPYYRFVVGVGTEFLDDPAEDRPLTISSTCADLTTSDDVNTILELEPILGNSTLCDIISINLKEYAITISSGGVDVTKNEGVASIPIGLYFSDENNNPLPAETAIAISTDNGVISGTKDIKLGNSLRKSASFVSFILTRESDPNNVTSGNIEIKFETPKENKRSASLQVRD